MRAVVLGTVLATVMFGTAHASNVALNGTVSILGNDFAVSDVNNWGAGAYSDPAHVVDGVFLNNGTQWNVGTTFWTGNVGADTITITLAHMASVNSITLQADNNDVYGIKYLGSDALWRDLATISAVDGWGLATRSVSFSPVVATAFQITAVGGDNLYSVSEFQADGSVAATPLPAAWGMMMLGLAGAGLVAKRRKNKAAST